MHECIAAETERAAADAARGAAPSAEELKVLRGRLPPPPPPPPSRTNWTRLVSRPVLTGHVSSLAPH